MLDRDTLRLRSMLKLIGLIRVHLADVDRATFLESVDYIDATGFRVLHIGEAAHRLRWP